MKYPEHQWEHIALYNQRVRERIFAARCMECGVQFKFIVTDIEMRDSVTTKDPRIFQWRLENEEIFLELNMPCTYPEPAGA